MRRQMNLPPNPIIDQLYALCKQLNQAAIGRDERRIQPLWDAFEVYYLMAQKAGERLPWPEEASIPSEDIELAYNDRLDFRQFQAVSSSVMREIEKRWKRQGLSLV